MTTITNDLFAFEVPTPKGTIRIIAPEDLTVAEAEAAVLVIANVLPLAVIGVDVPCPDCGHPESQHGLASNASAGCWNSDCCPRIKGKVVVKCHRGRPFGELTVAAIVANEEPLSVG